MTHCIAGPLIYLDIVHKNYRCQNFLLKISPNINNKCEALISFSASNSAFKTIVLSLWNNVQVSKLYMNSVLCNVPIVLAVAIISNAVARWKAMHVSVCKTLVPFIGHKIDDFMKFPVRNEKKNKTVR